MKNTFLCFLLVLGLFSCKKTETKVAKIENKYSLIPASDGFKYDSAWLRGVFYKDSVFTFDIEKYVLGIPTPDAGDRGCANADKGQHIHLIFNNEPYSAKYTSEFKEPLADGTHHMLAFLSRSYHESIKTKNAFIAGKITVKNNSAIGLEPIKEPMLFYSRPKGTQKGEETKKILLDFYPVNAPLGKDYAVKVSVNGEERIVESWQAYFIEGLPMGEHTIELTLLDKNREIVNSKYNPVKRTFTLEE